MADVTEFALANIVKVEIVTEESSPKTFTLIDMASEAEIDAFVSEGKEDILRVKNTIKAMNKLEDIVMGYDVKLTSVTAQPDVLALVDGGSWNEGTKKYTAPAIGVPVERTPFTLKVYTEDKDISGATKGYIVFVFLHCKGKPVNYSIKDGEFFSEELLARSRPSYGESPVTFEYQDEIYIYVAYEKQDDVTAILPVEVTFANDVFKVPLSVKGFTFTDENNFTATSTKGVWVIKAV